MVRFAIGLFLKVIYGTALIWLAGKVLQQLVANPTLWGNASKLVAVAVGTVISYSFMRFWIFANSPRIDWPNRELSTKRLPDQTSNEPEPANNHTIL